MDNYTDTQIKLPNNEEDFSAEVDECIDDLYKLVRLDTRIPLTHIVWVVSDLRELALTAYQRGRKEEKEAVNQRR